jgi:hypothetical protein
VKQEDFQLKWPEAELSRLSNRLQMDYRNALADHNKRMRRWRDYYRRWRAAVDTPAAGEEAASNVPVPYIRWNILTKWAKEIDSLFGDDAEIVAVPVGASDYKRDKKIGLYMTWRVFNSMKLIKPFCTFVLRKLLFGRSIAYAPWKRDTFEVLNPAKDYQPEDVVDYEGPDFEPLWPDDIIVPCEEVKTIHDFSFVIRKYRATPDKLLQGEAQGKYQGITKNWEKIVQQAQHGAQRESEGDEVKRAADEAEGLQYERPQSAGESLLVIEWYGKWRPLKKGPRGGMASASEYDFSKREMRQKDFVVRYIWDLNLIVGLQDLQELYPTKKNRRPFVESAMMADGTYWSPGMAEMLIDLEDELRVSFNQATEAAEFAICPPVGYSPASGLVPETIVLQPKMAIPMNDPSRDLVQFKIGMDVAIPQWLQQALLAFGEKLTGQGDLQMGRQSDRPNAPRTGVQTTALLEEGNVRISLDTKVLADDMSGVLSHFWDLEYMFSPEQTFFRVTEDDADGLFEVNNGASILSIEDRDGRYDFRLQFANSLHSREMKKQEDLALYQIDMQNPLIQSNPVAMWECTNRAHEALGDPNFADIVPRPPLPDLSIDPKEEWVTLLHGEDIHVNPQDNDQLHLLRHMRDIKSTESDPQHEPDVLKKGIIHYHDHILQLQQKKIQQAVIEQAVRAIAGGAPGAAGGGPGSLPSGLFGGTQQTQPAGNPAATGPSIYSGHPEVMHEQ